MEQQTILIVDDDREIVRVIAKILELEGYRTLKAYDGLEALDMLVGNVVHLIMIDIMMPNLDGYQACREIRELPRADAKTIPIIAMTANAFTEDREKAYSCGMNEHLAKPLDGKKLLETVSKYYK